MDWVAELRQKFQQVRGGQPTAPVSFTGQPGMLGELGQEFNSLAAELHSAAPEGLNREQAHRLRNHLAGVLAALHVLAEEATLTAQQQAQLKELLADARGLDARLRAQTR